MLAIWPMIKAFIILCIAALGVYCFVMYLRSSRRAIAQEAREDSTPRAWKFVNAYGPQQAESGTLLTYPEALEFLRTNIGKSFVRADVERGIIFFDGRSLGG